MVDEFASHPLSRFMTRLGGIDARTALEHASLRLEAMRDDLTGAVAFDVACLNAWMALIDGPPPEAVTAEVHRLANSIASVAGLVGLEDAGDAARSLCDTLDAFEESGVIDIPSIEVHVQSISLLAAGGATGETVERLRAGLRRVRERSGAT